MSDHININGLRLTSTVGVDENERSLPQSVRVNLSITPKRSFKGLSDNIENTINYFEVMNALKKEASKGQRKLIETLAEDLANEVVKFDGVCAVTLEVEKFILPDCESASVIITRAREGS